jgi:D-alanyl-D-alanine carboxypeptidase
LNDHQIAEGKTYTQCAMFLVDFHSPVDENFQGSLNLDSEYQDYNFWFAREDGGNWDLVDMGY